MTKNLSTYWAQVFVETGSIRELASSRPAGRRKHFMAFQQLLPTIGFAEVRLLFVLLLAGINNESSFQRLYVE